MFAPDAKPYPIRDEIDPEEDGVGYALRMANVNGLTFNDLARLLASPGHLYLPADNAAAIAFLFGGTPGQVGRAFVQRFFRGDSLGALFMGREFLRPYHLRQTRPQICPLCLRKTAQAKAIWSITLVTCCPSHGVTLIDRCVCGRKITWRRPSIDVCECGRQLTDRFQVVSRASPMEIEVANQIHYLALDAGFRLRARVGIPSVCDDVSIDIFLRLLWALGVLDPEAGLSHPRSANRIFSTIESAEILHRAISTLTVLTSYRKSAKSVLIAETALAAIYEDGCSILERPFIEYLIRRIPQSARSALALKRARKSMSAQLTLFGDYCDTSIT